MGEPWPRAATDLLAAAAPPPMDSLAGAVGPHAMAPRALDLYAVVLSASSLAAAAHSLVSALTVDFGFTRASIGLHSHGRTRLLAGSQLDLHNLQADLPQLLLGAMDEAIEQGISLGWPLPEAVPGADLIRLEHQSLQRQVGGSVATVPLGSAGEAFAAVTVERADTAFDAAQLARLEQLLALVAPALRWMHQAGQPWYQRAWRESVAGVAALRQPVHRRARRVLAALALGLLFLGLAPLETEVGGRARIEGARQRVVSAPTDGFVKAAHVRPGDRVHAGDPLVDLIEGDLQLERGRWTSQIEQHENAYAAAMSKSDRLAASTSMARIGEAQAQLALVDEQLARGRITAPFDAVVIQGDLSQSAGAPVRQGDTLLTLASTTGYRVIVDVDETDIAQVQPGQGGQLVLSSSLWDRQQLRVDRISPLSKAVEGRNVFEVEARLATPGPQLRPGLIGRAQIVTGRAAPLWSWTRHALDRVQLAWWSWLG